MQASSTEPLELNRDIVETEFPRDESGVLYLNTGSCGRKPVSVQSAVDEGLKRLNQNPTLLTFFSPDVKNAARKAAAQLFDLPPQSLILTGSTTQGLQLFMQSFLLKAGDELVTTDHEHGSLRAIARHLEETRGITVRRHTIDSACDSEQLALGLISLLSKRTRLVAVSEIDCFTGWRPDLSYLIEGLSLLDVPLLVDGAHSPGQGACRPSRYPLWVASGHKWLGGPNGTGFAYVSPEMASHIKPTMMGHGYYELLEADEEDLTRFECLGTEDQTRWLGLTQALNLEIRLKPDEIARRQKELMRYLRGRLADLKPVFRRQEPGSIADGQQTGMLAFYFEPDRLAVNNLHEALWTRHRIWVQPDFIGASPFHGMRISCHYSLTTENLDNFVQALSTLLK